jgi:ABC-type phosphate transport system substrate-binding protein/tetratricopeptide (TPR) repeat protein
MGKACMPILPIHPHTLIPTHLHPAQATKDCAGAHPIRQILSILVGVIGQQTEESLDMAMVVRNRSLLMLLVLAAIALPPGLSRSQAQTEEAPASAPAETTAPAADAPPADGAAPPAFTLPDSLPDGTTLTIDGSVAMTAINRSLVRQFEAAFPTATVTAQEQGVDAALQALLAGNLDLAAIGRPLDQEELAQGLVEVPISREKIAIIVSAENPFQGDLTFDQFAQIFRGEITNWSQIGGPDLPIKFVDRPPTSDTRRALGGYDIFKAGGGLTTGASAITVEADDTAAVVDTLGNNGISYAIASQVLDQDNVRPLTMHGTLPDDPRYPYSQPRGYVYQGDPSPAAAAFLAFATTPEGQTAVQEAKEAEAAEVATAELPNSTAAMRPNGQGFVTGDRDGSIYFWNADGSPAGEPLPAHTGPVTALAFAPDGNRLISGGADGTLRFWDAVGNPVGEPITAHDSPVTTVAVLPDGNFFTGTTDGTVQRWDTLGNAVGEPIAAHTGTVRSITTSPDGQTVATAGKDGTAKLWGVDGTGKATLSGHQGPVNAVAMKPDGTVVTGGEDGTVRQWDGSGAAVGEPQTLAGPVNAIAVSGDGQKLAAGDETGTVQPFGPDGAPSGDAIDSGDAPVGDLAFTPDGSRLVVSTEGSSPQVRDEAGQLVTPAATEPLPDPEGDADPLTGLWQQLQRIPPRFWILIPILLLALVVWSILKGYLQEFGDDDEAPAAEETPPAPEPEVTPAAPVASGGDDWGDFDNFDGGAAADFGADSATAADFSADDFAADDFAAADFSSPGESAADGNDFADVPPGAGEVTPTAPETVPPAIAAVGPYEANNALDRDLSKAKMALREGVDLAKAGKLQTALERVNLAIESADVERLKALAAGVSLAGVGAVVARGMARRGGILAALGRGDEALKSYDRALQMDDDAPENWVGKGNLLLQLQRPDEALFCFDKAIELNPRTGSAWQGKGTALQRLNRDSEAQTALAKAAELGPGGDSTIFTPMAGVGGGLAAAAGINAFAGWGQTPATEGAAQDPDGEVAAGAIDEPDQEPSEPPTDIPVPEDIHEAVSFLPEEPDLPNGSADVPPITVPPEVQAMLDQPDLDPDTIPSDLWDGDGGIVAADPPASAPAPVAPPPAEDPSPGDRSFLDFENPIAADLADIDDDIDEEPIDDLTLFSSGEDNLFSSPAPTVSDIQPEAGDDSPWFDDDIPAEVLAALGSIPADSPDSFNPPAPPPAAVTPPPPPPRRPATPPPLPNNPRLKNNDT